MHDSTAGVGFIIFCGSNGVVGVTVSLPFPCSPLRRGILLFLRLLAAAASAERSDREAAARRGGNKSSGLVPLADEGRLRDEAEPRVLPVARHAVMAQTMGVSCTTAERDLAVTPPR